MIKRNFYLKKIKKWIDFDTVKVITWIRRCWKTYFLKQIINLLIEEKTVNKENIIYIDKENLTFDFIKNYEDLFNYIEEKIKNLNWKIYIFIDEIQDIINWEKTIRNYSSNKNFDIYITWSNSNLLSSELSSFLTWRYIEIHLYPLNFKEFLEFRNNFNYKKDGFKNWFWEKEYLKYEFNNYIKYWWFPAIHKVEFDDEMVYSYLNWIFDSIIFKDIVSRYNIRNSNLLLDIFKFVSDNIWNIVSSKKIADYLNNQKINISFDTLREYLNYFQKTFLLSKVSRYDLKWKKILDIIEKYYVWDLWFRNYLLWFRENDIWQYLENLVFLELKIRWYEVFVGKINDLEIDFIAKKAWIVEYYQVCYLLASKETIDREFWNLEKINDNYPKIVLSMDEIFTWDYNWIKRINIIDWLLS